MKDRQGFTLIEIIIALTIVAIGSVIAISNLQSWVYQTNARGFQREVYSRLQEARIRASSSGGRHRVVLNLTNGTADLQLRGASSWSDLNLPRVGAPTGSRFASVTPNPGSAVATGTYALVFNPSGEVYGQSTIANDNTIALIDNAIIRLTGVNPQDNGSITLFGWTGKARLN